MKPCLPTGMRALRPSVGLASTAIAGLLVACGQNQTFVSTAVDSPALCVPTLDGRIDRAEFGVEAGAVASYERVSGLVVSTEGQVDADGVRFWPFDAPWTGAEAAPLTVLAAKDQWYAGLFPSDALGLPAGDGTDTVVRWQDSTLQLLGIVSHTSVDETALTRVVYDAPIVFYRFPLSVGDGWTSTANVRDARIGGIPYAGTDTYTVRIAASGRVELPEVRVRPALQAVIDVDLVGGSGGAFRTHRRQISWLAECAGELVRVVQPDGGPSWAQRWRPRE